MEAKHKRTNLGEKEEPITETKREKNRIHYPSFCVRKKLPIDKTNIGKTFNVSAKIKLTGMRQDAMDVNKVNYNYDFDVIEIGF